jgi:imidazoleglycerol phosphate synthase glutamine amidotransferase subunit HisH
MCRQGSGFTERHRHLAPEEVRAAERIVLPGPGRHADCMRELRESA